MQNGNKKGQKKTKTRTEQRKTYLKEKTFTGKEYVVTDLIKID